MTRHSLTPNNLSPRAMGVILLIVGVVTGYIGFYEPLAAVWKHATHAWLHLEAVILVPMCFGFGIAYLLYGEKALELLGSTKHPTRKGWMLFIFLTAVGIICFFFMVRYMRSHGFHF